MITDPFCRYSCTYLMLELCLFPILRLSIHTWKHFLSPNVHRRSVPVSMGLGRYIYSVEMRSSQACIWIEMRNLLKSAFELEHGASEVCVWVGKQSWLKFAFELECGAGWSPRLKLEVKSAFGIGREARVLYWNTTFMLEWGPHLRTCLQ